jgi:hypothetical protein
MCAVSGREAASVFSTQANASTTLPMAMVLISGFGKAAAEEAVDQEPREREDWDEPELH